MRAVFLGVLIWSCVLCLDFNYHDNESLENFLRNMSQLYPNLTKLYSIGKTVESKHLHVIYFYIKLLCLLRANFDITETIKNDACSVDILIYVLTLKYGTPSSV